MSSWLGKQFAWNHCAKHGGVCHPKNCQRCTMSWQRLRFLMVLFTGFAIILACCLVGCEGINQSGLEPVQPQISSDASWNVRGETPIPPATAHPVGPRQHDSGLPDGGMATDAGSVSPDVQPGNGSADAGGDTYTCHKGEVYPCETGLCQCP